MADLKISQLESLGLLEAVDLANDVFPVAKNFGIDGNRKYTLLDIWLAIKSSDTNPFPQYNVTEVVTYNASHTIASEDVHKYLRIDSASDVTVTIDQSSFRWPAFGEVHIEQAGDGKVTLVIESSASGTLMFEGLVVAVTRGKNTVVTLKKVVHAAAKADDKFNLFGGLELA